MWQRRNQISLSLDVCRTSIKMLRAKSRKMISLKTSIFLRFRHRHQSFESQISSKSFIQTFICLFVFLYRYRDIWTPVLLYIPHITGFVLFSISSPSLRPLKRPVDQSHVLYFACTNSISQTVDHKNILPNIYLFMPQCKWRC